MSVVAATGTLDDTGRTVASSWGLFMALGLLMLGSGLLGTLLGVRARLEEFGITVTGFVMASYYLGFLFGSQITPKMISRVGHVRVYAALASVASTSALVHVALPAPAPWAVMRLITGFCLAGLYVVAESWLNARATNATRGRLLSVYMIVIMSGLGLGQLLLGLADPQSFRLFVLASVLVSLAVVPISLSAAPPPGFQVPERIPLGELWAAAPLGIIGGLGTGMANGALIGMGAYYATSIGMSPPRVAVFMGAAVFGSVALQWPIGALSDKIPRRRAIAGVTIAAGGVALVATQLSGTGVLLIVTMSLLGGLSFPLYSLNLSHINDVIPGDQTVMASSLFVFITGLGAILGPVTAAALMASPIGDAGFFWNAVLVHGAIGAFALYRIAVRSEAAMRGQKPYVPSPARATAILMRMTKARLRNGRDRGEL